jgi:hypothetical protein
MAREVDGAHAAFAELALHDVVADGAAEHASTISELCPGSGRAHSWSHLHDAGCDRAP